MTAFGPYKYSETVDFTELEENHLFVISGNTGAGKTTIFDGICFALYGSASGSDRENQMMLRSDFAEDDTHTAVELEFELHGKTYRILRQLGHVKKGNKTKTGDRYEFYQKVDDGEIPCVDRQIVSEIDKKVEMIIGLTKDQFKQIVMLPQGEFRKLLTSETENKEEILRRIFKTESYKQIGERLKVRKQSGEQAYLKEKQQVDHYIASISTSLPKRDNSLLFDVIQEEHFNLNQVLAGLEEEKVYYSQQIIEKQKQYDEAYAHHQKQQEFYYQAKALNDRFRELEEKKARQIQLEQKIPAVKIKEEELKDAERASSIEMYEKQVAVWKREEKDKSNLVWQAKERKNHTKAELEKALERWNKEEGKKEEREKLRKTLDQLYEFLPIVKEIDTTKKELVGLYAKERESAKLLDQLKAAIEAKQKDQATNFERIKELDGKTASLYQKQSRYQELREKGKVLLSYTNLLKKKAELEKEVATKEKDFQEIKSHYKNQEEIWLNNQASVLAVHLHDGEACPVCGSVEHPNKATDNGQVTSRKALDALKTKRDEKESVYREAKALFQANEASLEEKEVELTALQIEKEEAVSNYNEVVKEGKQLKVELDQLSKAADELRKLREAHELEVNKIKELQGRQEELNSTYQVQKEAYQTAKIRYEERINRIPEAVRELPVLEKNIRGIEEQKARLEKEWEAAQNALEQAKEQDTKATSDVEHVTKQLEETKEKREQSEKEFNQHLKEAGFLSIEEYEKAKMAKQDQENLKESIQRFLEELTMVTSQIQELSHSLKDKEKQNLVDLEEKLAQWKVNYEQAWNQLHAAKEYEQQTEKWIDLMIEGNERIRKWEKELETITDLSNVIRGQNDKRISFERYLQIEYLERIIEAANLRLKRISGGQFYLIRSDRQESHGKQSGLGLDVYDTYTGQTRDVKTLSGGEKFNASLCLALGMSDVIQSFQGNISIDTMFIDEGFGSLDEESLNKAIDTLIELQQSGRMIGVISHVQELKNMFPAVLQVAKTKEGYSKTNFVLK